VSEFQNYERGGGGGSNYADHSWGSVTHTQGSSDSTTLEVQITHAEPPPPAPSSLSASVSGDDITLDWTDNSDNEDGLRIYRAQSSGSAVGDYNQVADIGANQTTYTDSGLLDGTRYHYRVVAYNTGGGESNPSNEATATTVLPAPTNLSVSNVTADSADLSWTDNHDNGETIVEYKPTSDSSWTEFSTLSVGTEAETLTGLRNGEAYDVRLLATTTDAQTEDT
jgi:hypothetical protein